MILQAILAIILTWLTLFALLHITLFVACWVHKGSAEQLKETAFYQGLLFISPVLLFPVFVPYVLYRHCHRFLIAYRMALKILDRVGHAPEVNLTVLPFEEQQSFLQRMRTDQDKSQVLRDIKARVREVQEAVK